MMQAGRSDLDPTVAGQGVRLRCRKASLYIEIGLRQRRAASMSACARPIARYTTPPCRSGGTSNFFQHQAFSARPRGAHRLPTGGVKANRRAVGKDRLRLHPAVRGPRHDAGHGHAGRAAATAREGAQTLAWRIRASLGRGRSRGAGLGNRHVSPSTKPPPDAPRTTHPFVDIDQRRVLFVADGRDANTVAAFADDLGGPQRRCVPHQEVSST